MRPPVITGGILRAARWLTDAEALVASMRPPVITGGIRRLAEKREAEERELQ